MRGVSTADLLAVLTACEVAVWDALVQGDQARDDAALDPEFLGVYADGFATKADHVGQLDNGPTIARYRLGHMRIQVLGPDCAVLSYRADFLRSGKADPEAMYVSSIWRRIDGQWRNIFSQDTAAID